ncbi:MAG: pyrroline-5-carboxylate reductase [Eubacteriales bacterium]
MNRKFAFIGSGELAGAITECLTTFYYGGEGGEPFVLYDVNKVQYEKFTGKNFEVADSIKDAVFRCDIIVLSVKPQHISSVLTEIKEGCPNLSGKTFILPAAGVYISRVTDVLGNVPVIRIMPNMPLKIGYGVTALCANSFVSPDVYSFVKDVFAAGGMTFELPESSMNPVIAATSSSPAYVYLFIKAMIDGCKATGLDPDVMLEPICRTVIGSVNMLLYSGKTPDELISMVATPGGTTERALSILQKRGFCDAVFEAMLDCTRRADEMSKF